MSASILLLIAVAIAVALAPSSTSTFIPAPDKAINRSVSIFISVLAVTFFSIRSNIFRLPLLSLRVRPDLILLILLRATVRASMNDLISVILCSTTSEFRNSSRRNRLSCPSFIPSFFSISAITCLASFTTSAFSLASSNALVLKIVPSSLNTFSHAVATSMFSAASGSMFILSLRCSLTFPLIASSKNKDTSPTSPSPNTSCIISLAVHGFLSSLGCPLLFRAAAALSPSINKKANPDLVATVSASSP